MTKESSESNRKPDETWGEGTLPMFSGGGSTHLKLKERPESLDKIRVTLNHPSGKRVDIANKDIELEGRVIKISDEVARSYANIYEGEADSETCTIELSWNEENQ